MKYSETRGEKVLEEMWSKEYEDETIFVLRVINPNKSEDWYFLTTSTKTGLGFKKSKWIAAASKVFKKLAKKGINPRKNKRGFNDYRPVNGLYWRGIKVKGKRLNFR